MGRGKIKLSLGDFVYYCGKNKSYFEPGEYLKVINEEPLEFLSVKTHRIASLEIDEIKLI
jgi:hypothetical protein|tara:strand:- start:2428 stop:2607 length:180 start_codon:yes stop_codon:yes gene_type:complete